MIKDKIHLQGFPTMKMPKIKGHVKIRLYNPNTWKQEIIEGENMITNALADIFASNKSGALNYRTLLPLYSKMLGGILCFKNQLNVGTGTEDDYFIPDNGNNQIIAHAGQNTFSDQSDDVTRGNPLSTSMTITDGAITNAWEWGSSAGNGEISSVALTHTDVGDAGTGSESNAFKAMKPVINAKFGTELTFTHGGGDINNMVLFIGSDGYGYRFWTSGQTVTIIKIPFAYEKTGLVAMPPFTDTDQNETHNVTTTTNYGSYRPYYCYDKANHKLWLFYNTSNSRAVKVEEIDLSTYTATNHDSAFSNLDASVGALYNYFPLQVPFDNGYVYLRLNRTTGLTYQCNGFLKIQLSNVANQTELDALVVPFGGVFETGTSGKVIAGKQFVINNNVLYPCTSDDGYNATAIENVSFFPFTEDRAGLAKLGGQFAYNNGGQAYFVAISKFYLATKYNLPSPVTKSNSQNMVVTYTLTEVEE